MTWSLVLPLAFWAIGAVCADDQKWTELTDLSIEELMNVQVVTASKTLELRSRVPAAVFVITQEDLQRTGVRAIPEALRRVPGVHVSRINSNQWAVGVRGFSGRLSRSLLVLINGRSVYNPLFAGVYWEAQNTLFEDIERIEVILGPAGSIWGANAVNGVINIITKSAEHTQGGLVNLGGGTEQKGFGALRYGGSFGNDAFYEVHGNYFDRDSMFHEDGDRYDAWRMGQIGFQTEWRKGTSNRWIVQGETYHGKLGQRATVTQLNPPAILTQRGEGTMSGVNFSGAWERNPSSTTDSSLQFFYAHNKREDLTFEEVRDTFDLEYRSRHALEKHELAWGLGYRTTADDTSGALGTQFIPMDRASDTFSVFVQDIIPIRKNKTNLTLGTKIEHNDFTGLEVQPNIRFTYLITPEHTFWSAVSRAVRAPSRIEHDLELAVWLDAQNALLAEIRGNPAFESEDLLSFEFGYRGQFTAKSSFSGSFFYNNYENLLSVEPGPPEVGANPSRTILPFFFGNMAKARTWGGELDFHWKAFDRWLLQAKYAYLNIDLELDPASGDTGTEAAIEGTDPTHWLFLQSTVQIRQGLDFNTELGYVDALPAQGVDSYWNLNVNLTWQAAPDLKFSFVGHDLLKDHHFEFDQGTGVERGYYGRMSYTW